jgi:hypothetical protein
MYVKDVGKTKNPKSILGLEYFYVIFRVILCLTTWLRQKRTLRTESEKYFEILFTAGTVLVGQNTPWRYPSTETLRRYSGPLEFCRVLVPGYEKETIAPFRFP